MKREQSVNDAIVRTYMSIELQITLVQKLFVLRSRMGERADAHYVTAEAKLILDQLEVTEFLNEIFTFHGQILGEVQGLTKRDEEVRRD